MCCSAAKFLMAEDMLAIMRNALRKSLSPCKFSSCRIAHPQAGRAKRSATTLSIHRFHQPLPGGPHATHRPEKNRSAPSSRTGPRTRAGRASAAPIPPPTSSACAARFAIEHTLARRGAEKLWNLVNTEPFVNTLGALTGNQAMQQVKAGLKAIYLSGWQVAGDANIAGEMYPDQSLYPVNSVPSVVKRINNTFTRADQIQWSEGKDDIDYFAPIVADAEAGFGGVLNAFELMKAMIEAGAAGVHFEDQLASVKKCGHMGGKVLVPTREANAKLTAARLAADVMGVPTLVIARTDAEAADLVTSDVDENDKPLPDRRAHGRGLLPHAARASTRRSSRGLAYSRVRRHGLVRDRQARPRLRQGVRRGDPQEVPGQAAGVQLLAELQLEEEPRRRDHRQVPARARRDGLQVPVHHPGRLPQPELLDVQPGARLRAEQHDARSSSCRKPSSPRRRRASPRSSTSARSAPATSTR